MARFLVENSGKKQLTVAIEPWASVEVLAPGGIAYFEYSSPGEIEFSVRDDGSVVVGVITDHVKVSANGAEKEFGNLSSKFDVTI